MNKKEKIKVLIVEDSRVFSELLRVGLEKDSLIEVVDVVSDPYMARDKIIQYRPDVMTLDVELPRMNGIEFLKRLMPQYPIPVVVVSAAADTVLEMRKYGAVDFIAKPVNKSAADNFINELTVKIKIASISKLSYLKSNFPNTSNIAESFYNKINIVAVGASTGGTEALEQVLRALPREMPGIVIVQHMPPVFTKMYAERLNNNCILEVKEAEDGDLVMPGRVLIAPGGSHMKVIKNGTGYSVRCLNGEKVNGHCPSVDVLFYSVAENCDNKAMGIILTGMGHDGANGLLEMRKKGDRTIGQDKDSCIVYGMPKVAYELGAVEKQVSLDDIPKEIQSVLKEQNK
ncbi:MAG: chemotaxis response regulator protein-glutamate methylesterase [Clostridiaceae bacterium]